MMNGRQILKALNPPVTVTPPKDMLDSVAFLPHVGSTFNPLAGCYLGKISNQLASCWKLSGFLLPVMDNLGLRTLGVYSIPHECGQIYNGQRGCSISTRLKEYHWHIWLEHPDKLEMAKHSINLGHPVQLHNTILVSASCWVYYKQKVLWYHQHNYLTFDTFYFPLHPSTLITGSSSCGKIFKNISLFNCHA
jgi:hypothetical protein